jgi:hypothetical protein
MNDNDGSVGVRAFTDVNLLNMEKLINSQKSRKNIIQLLQGY